MRVILSWGFRSGHFFFFILRPMAGLTAISCTRGHQPINKSYNLQYRQTTNQPINLSHIQSTDHSTDQSIDQPTNQTVKQPSINHSRDGRYGLRAALKLGDNRVSHDRP